MHHIIEVNRMQIMLRLHLFAALLIGDNSTLQLTLKDFDEDLLRGLFSDRQTGSQRR